MNENELNSFAGKRILRELTFCLLSIGVRNREVLHILARNAERFYSKVKNTLGMPVIAFILPE